MFNYELYVCGHKIGCTTLKEFNAHHNLAAKDIALKAISDYEDNTGDYIYREYLFRNDENGQVEIEI
mgnify:CR=1 FL=1|tara:strand:- start:22 stop:222 length:201 start_codon:yes stop_codon:yes gene_type:complete